MLKLSAITDTGLKRRDNQDTYRLYQAEGKTVCVVCDGVGGAAGGSLASTLAAERYISAITPLMRPDMTAQQLREASSFAVASAHRAVEERARQAADLSEMGTTLVAAAAYDGGVVISNVGDSRAYHITPQGITQVTRDHSYVETMLQRGYITADQALHHPKRNQITRALGLGTDAQCDGYICPLSVGEYILLCTDGLVNTVTDQELLEHIAQGAEGCLERLLELAKDRGAPDNVTAVLMQQA